MCLDDFTRERQCQDCDWHGALTVCTRNQSSLGENYYDLACPWCGTILEVGLPRRTGVPKGFIHLDALMNGGK